MKVKFLLLLICLVLFSCSLEGEPTSTSSFIRKICIENHYYYKTISLYEGGIAPLSAIVSGDNYKMITEQVRR